MPFLTSTQPMSAPSKFTSLPQDLVHQILHNTLHATAAPGAALRAGCKLYKISDLNSDVKVKHSASAIGEVLVTSANALAGMAMINLESLNAASPCVFAVVDKKGDGEGGEDGDSPEASEGSKEDMSVLGFVSPFRPSWFTGLDENTNLPV